MANLVVHFEIHASEPQKLIDFYSNLLGWSFQDYGGGEQPYWVIETGEGAIQFAAIRRRKHRVSAARKKGSDLSFALR